MRQCVIFNHLFRFPCWVYAETFAVALILMERSRPGEIGQLKIPETSQTFHIAAAAAAVALIRSVDIVMSLLHFNKGRSHVITVFGYSSDTAELSGTPMRG